MCALLGVLDPISADPKGDWFTFEKGASKTSGGNGWADVWRRECFGWEYKGRHANTVEGFWRLFKASVHSTHSQICAKHMQRLSGRVHFQRFEPGT